MTASRRGAPAARLPAARRIGAVLIAAAGLAAGLTVAGPFAAARADDGVLARCAVQQDAVLAALEARDAMRDEAYTAIMWARMDAEEAYRRGDGAACLEHLDLPRRALGLHEESVVRR